MTSARADVEVEGATVTQVDLCDAAAVDAFVRDAAPDIVVHLASAVTGARGRDAVRPTFEQNVTSTVHLLDALGAHRPDARVVHAGSLEEPEPGDAPSSPYAASKAAAGAYVRLFHSLYGMPTTIARIFMVYGPGVQNEQRLVPYVIRTLLAGEVPSLSSGTRQVDWVHVDDVVEGLTRLAVAPADAVAGRTIDLGTGALTTVRDVATRAGALVDASVTLSFGALEDRALEQVRVADVPATRAALGWAPSITVADGLVSTVAWFRANP